MGLKRLGQAAITTGTGTLIYTAPTGYRTELRDICIANTGVSAITCKLHLAPVGVAVGTSNLLFPDVSIPCNTLVQWTGVQVMNAGDFIQGIGSAAGITVTITGDELRAGT